MKRKYTVASISALLLLVGCASDPEVSSFDKALYSGKPVDSLSSEEPATSEVEAISRGDIALQSNNIDLALYEYISSLSFPGSKYQDKTLYNIGKIHSSKGNSELEEKAYRLALEENGNNAQVLEALGVVRMKSRKYDEANSYFLRALNADQLRLKSGLTVNSIETLDVAPLPVELNSPLQAYLGIGIISDINDNYPLAKNCYDKVLSVDPYSLEALINKGYSSYMSGEYDDARLYTRSALDLDGDNKKALNNLALIYLSENEIKPAINVFMKSMDVPEALNNVGYFLIIQGKPEQAIPYLQQAIDKKSSYYKIANENLDRALEEVRESSN